MSRVRENRTHGSTGRGWKRSSSHRASPSPNQPHGPSPTQLLPLGVPQVLFTGSKCCYEDTALRYARAAAAAGDSVKATVFKGPTHFDQVDPCGPAWPRIVKAVFTLLDEKATARDLRGPGPRLCRRMHIDQPALTF